MAAIVSTIATQELTAIDPPHRWSLHGIDGPVRADLDLRVEGLEGGTRSRVTITLDFFGRGAGRLAVPLVAQGAARELAQSAEALRARLNRPAGATG